MIFFFLKKNVVCKPCALHRVRQGVQDGDLVHACHGVGLDDQIFITSTFGLSEEP